MITPTLTSRSPLVITITSAGQTYYQINDEQIRSRWIYQSISDAFGIAFLCSLAAYMVINLIEINAHKQDQRTS